MTSQNRIKQSSRLTKMMVNGLIVLGMSILLMVLAEALLRTFFPQNLVGTKITGETFSEPDAVLGMRYKPGARWRFTHPEYRTEYSINEHGFRDEKAHPVPKPAGTIRVLLLGDSFTFGQGVNYEQTWPVIVETRLAESGHNHIDLVKAGIQGMDTRSEFILLQRLSEKYQYDVVVVGFLINDLYSNTLYGFEENDKTSTTNDVDRRIPEKQNASADSWFEMAKQVFIQNNQQTTFHLLAFAKRIAISSEAVYCKLYFAAPNRRNFLTLPLSPGPEKKLNITKVLFEKMAAYSHAAGKKLIVLSIPQQSQVLCFEKLMNSQTIDVTVYDRYFSDFAKHNVFTWITTLTAFNKSKRGKDSLFYRLDGHLTPVGNQIVAEVFLQEIIPLISETKSELR